MRSSTARFVLVVALLFIALPAAADAPADPVPPHPPSPLAGLPTDVFHGQVVTLADGDRYEVTFAQQGQSIRGRRWDSATQTWGPRQVIFKDPDLRCWGLHARGSGNGVAVRVGCGPAFVEDWDGHPYAVVSADAEHWQSRRLPGYSWWAPGISPDGTRAVWARGDDTYTWSPTAGFVRGVAAPPPDAFQGEAPMITDAGLVTIAYTDDSCSVTLDTYLTAGVPTRQVLPMTPYCYVVEVSAIDSRTLAVGDTADEWTVTRVTRPDDGAPWVVSTGAPLSAPGLLEDSFAPDMAPLLLDAPDHPLAVVGNGQDVLRVQVYDPATQAWQAPTTLLTRPGGTRCTFRNDFTAGLGFYALALRCAGPDRVVTSPDGSTWTAVPLAAQTAGPNGALGLLAVPGRSSTVVLDRDSATTVPVGVRGACDVVVPVAHDRVLRLTAPGGGDGWPSLLQRSTARGWKTVHRVRTPTSGTCSRVFPGLDGGPRFGLQGRDGYLGVRFVQVDGRWDVRVRLR